MKGKFRSRFPKEIKNLQKLIFLIFISPERFLTSTQGRPSARPSAAGLANVRRGRVQRQRQRRAEGPADAAPGQWRVGGENPVAGSFSEGLRAAERGEPGPGRREVQDTCF